MYHAMFLNGEIFSHPLTKVVCVGRNYAEHARELNNPVPDSPILFIKPESSVVDLHAPLIIPAVDCHYETEVAVLIGAELSGAPASLVAGAIAGIGLGLDLTRRELQSQLKAKSHPWDIAKSFDGACPLSQFIPAAEFADLRSLAFSLTINGELRQAGNTDDMLTQILPLISYMSHFFTLRAGDVVLTGTPKGVGELKRGDSLSLMLADKLSIATRAA
jgi:2-keto-4-pentenoate hydratase/2-oxohepta-3-ene-1,7-dioic acid hydratase in catechol pathway